MRPVLAALLAGVALLAAPGPAHAQVDSREGIALQNQILELRRDLEGQQRGGGLPPPTRIAPQAPAYGGSGEIATQLLDRVARLEDELRRLRGQMDELANQTRRQADDLDKQIADLTFRLQNAPPSQTQAPRLPPATLNSPDDERRASPPAEGRRAPSGRRPPELAMQEGNAALARRDYAAAETAAREVLAAGRSTPRSGDAQFLLAQSLAGKRDYQGAAVAYDDAYNRSRTGSRAPDALLGLATALTAINEKPAACATLDKLRAEFPNPSAQFREVANASRIRAGCR